MLMGRRPLITRTIIQPWATLIMAATDTLTTTVTRPGGIIMVIPIPSRFTPRSFSVSRFPGSTILTDSIALTDSIVSMAFMATGALRSAVLLVLAVALPGAPPGPGSAPPSVAPVSAEAPSPLAQVGSEALAVGWADLARGPEALRRMAVAALAATAAAVLAATAAVDTGEAGWRSGSREPAGSALDLQRELRSTAPAVFSEGLNDSP